MPYLFISTGLAIIFLAVLLHFLRQYHAVKFALKLVFLRVTVPRVEDAKEQERSKDKEKDFKESVSIMEQLLVNLSSLLKHKWYQVWQYPETLSFEWVASKQLMYFYIAVPRGLETIVEKQITSYYPDASIDTLPEYPLFQKGMATESTLLVFKEPHYLPLRTYSQLESDPLNAVINAFSKLGESDLASLQLTVSVPNKRRAKKGKKVAKDLFQGKPLPGNFTVFSPLKALWHFFTSISTSSSKSEPKRLTPREEEKVKLIEGKVNKTAFSASLRIVITSTTEINAKLQMKNILTALNQFSSPDLNRLVSKKYLAKKDIERYFLLRQLQPGKRNQLIVNTEEVASIFHLPNTRFNSSPALFWQSFRIAPAPAELPKDGVLLGYNVYRGEIKEVRIQHSDRFRHFYVIGQTGTGKSTILQTMIRQDLQLGNGLCVIDPHGELIEDILPFIPKSRVQDVIYFNPGDTDRPMGLNILEATTPEEKDFISTEALNIMIKLYGEEIFSPRLQDYFRNGCLTLMDDPEGGCITDIVRLFTDDTWQSFKSAKVQNPIVKSFWTKQMAMTGAREKQEMIPYFAAKFGAFITNTLMRNILGQTKSAFDFSDVMNNKKILLVNLCKGMVGDFNANLLGMIIVAKLQVAAMRRVSGPKTDFFLYIDEFQNFVTDSIETILSEARKYRLGLIMAHQFIPQLIRNKNDTKIRDAVFGNVGTILSYKIGVDSAEVIGKEMAPVFSEQDLLNIGDFKAALKLCVNNKPTRPFTLNVIKPWEISGKGNPRIAQAVKELSRLKYGVRKDFVNQEILARIGA
ncbi:MAG: ATP-binding protein [Candidatus Abawacabacteria bacterium]|nr:ATP-binding protein [Candidatus Abawacabacteria bacterium]